MLNQLAGNLWTAMFKFFRRCTISQNDGFGPAGHGLDGFIILRPDGIVDLQQSGFIGGAVGVDVADQLTAEAPGTRKFAGFTQGGIAVVQTGNAGVHENPKHQRLGVIPNLRQLVAIAAAIRESGCDLRISGPSGTRFSTRIVLPAGLAHEFGAFGSTKITCWMSSVPMSLRNLFSESNRFTKNMAQPCR